MRSKLPLLALALLLALIVALMVSRKTEESSGVLNEVIALNELPSPATLAASDKPVREPAQISEQTPAAPLNEEVVTTAESIPSSTFSGYITTQSGDPLEGWKVSLSFPIYSTSPPWPQKGSESSVLNTQGFFRISNLPAGVYSSNWSKSCSCTS